MATLTTSAPLTVAERQIPFHRLTVSLAAVAIGSLIVWLAVHGWSYYLLSLEDRPLSPLHAQLRPSGPIGVRLGILGVIMFGVLFLYPLRKRWPWLSTIGTTRRWLDFHVLMGITAPIIISFHSTFKQQGLAGLAYWIMVLVALSGFAGRYVYAQIPRSINSAQLSMAELGDQTRALAGVLAGQHMFASSDLEPLLRVPSAEQVKSLGLFPMLWLMILNDISRPLRIARLRRRVLRGTQLVWTLGGLLRSTDKMVESVVASVRRQSWLLAKMAFLHRTERILHLWHVIHRPFSLSFIALVVIHVSLIITLGYY